MTPKPPTPTTTLRDNIELDLEAVFEDPKVVARKWLIQYIEEKQRKEEGCQKS